MQEPVCSAGPERSRPRRGSARQRVLLNDPPTITNDPQHDAPNFGSPGLAAVAGYLRSVADCEVVIVDSKLERLDFEQTLERIEDFRPDVIGFTALTFEIKSAARAAALARSRLPGVVTVIGGVHVTALPRETLVEFPEFDLGVYGEGEITFAELCRALDAGGEVGGIDGLVHRKSGQVRATNPRQRILDLDALPLPAWDLLPRAPQYFIQTVRGCPFDCKFCMNHNGKAVRARSVENVLAEIAWIAGTWEPAEISFGDEIFTVDLERTKAILKAVIDRGLHDGIAWNGQTHVRYVDEELFALLGRMKVGWVALGVETGDEEILKRVGKGTTVDMIVHARNLARRHGVPISSLMVIGHPNETVGSIWNSIRLAAKLNAEEPVFGVMTPYPGTDVAALAARGEAGYRLLSTDWDDYRKHSAGVLQFANLPPWSIGALQSFAYVCVFLWNLRFLDLARFAWKYRTEGLNVLKQMARHVGGPRQSASPARVSGVRPDAIAEASTVWREWQVSELGRARRVARAESRSAVSRESAP